jgi:hypothetical protein
MFADPTTSSEIGALTAADPKNRVNLALQTLSQQTPTAEAAVA